MSVIGGRFLAVLLAFVALAAKAGDPEYLSFKAVGGAVTVSMASSAPLPSSVPALETSFDRVAWTAFTAGSTSVSVAAGKTVYFRRNGAAVDTLNPGHDGSYWKFVLDGETDAARVEAGGSAMSLLDGSCASRKVGVAAFKSLFSGCARLTSAPELPATELAESCYSGMFSGCARLTTAPALPATELAPSCYYTMFSGCAALNAITVAFTDWAEGWNATEYWVEGTASEGTFTCPSALPVEYSDPFSSNRIPEGWTVSHAAPLKVTVPAVADMTYSIFSDGAAIAENEHEGGTYSLYSAPGVSITAVFTATGGFLMPSGEKSVSYDLSDRLISVEFGTGEPLPRVTLTPLGPLSFKAIGGPATISMRLQEDGWTPPSAPVLETSFDRVTWTAFTAGETFVSVDAGKTVYFRRKGVAADTLNPGTDGSYWKFVLEGETDAVRVEAGGNAMSLLDASCVSEKVGTSAFLGLFGGCARLTTAPALPAKTLAEDCYDAMFAGCTALTVAPVLPADELADYCYYEMFAGCTALNAITVGFRDWAADRYATSDWVKNVSPEGTFVCPDALAVLSGNDLIPDGWSVQDGVVWSVDIPVVGHLSARLTAESFGENGLLAETHGCAMTHYEVRGGAKVTVTFAADEGFRLRGDETVVIERITQDVVFGTTPGCPLPQVDFEKTAQVMFEAGKGVDAIAFRLKGTGDFVDFPPSATNLGVGAELELQVTPSENYRYTGPTEFTVPAEGLSETLTGVEIAPGDPLRKWKAGEAVSAWTNGNGRLVIEGTGEMFDFASAADVPWAAAAKDVREVSVGGGVSRIGANAWAGMVDAVTVNGTALSSVRFIAPGLDGPASPVGAACAAFETVEIVNGSVTVGISVCTNGDLSAETAGWGKAKIEAVNRENDGTATVTVPATADRGFMILKSGPRR